MEDESPTALRPAVSFRVCPITYGGTVPHEVETEGTEEATNYDKFACFCKKTNNKKAPRRERGVQWGVRCKVTLADE